MTEIDHPWQSIYESEGRVFYEPISRFEEIVKAFQEHGCVTVLDLGCGAGRHTAPLAEAGFQVVGLDISPAGLRLNRDWLAEEGQLAALLQADFRQPLPFTAGTFDAVFSTQVIHHALLAQVLVAIDNIWRVLSPGGLAFVSVAGHIHEDERYEQIEPETFLPLDGPEAGLPHHIFSEAGLRQAFGRFAIVEVGRHDQGRVLAILARKG